MKNAKKSFIAILLPLMLCFTAFAFCGCSDDKEYALFITGETELLYAPLESSYDGGDTVTVKINMPTDTKVVVTVNGENVEGGPVKENDRYTHWEYVFTMPDKDSTLKITTEDGILG